MYTMLGLSMLPFLIILVIGVLVFVLQRSSRSKKKVEQQRIKTLEEENQRLRENQKTH